MRGWVSVMLVVTVFGTLPFIYYTHYTETFHVYVDFPDDLNSGCTRQQVIGCQDCGRNVSQFNVTRRIFIKPPSVRMDQLNLTGSYSSVLHHTNSSSKSSIVLTSDLSALHGSVPWRNNTKAPRAMTRENYNKLMGLMVSVNAAFKELNVTWVMNYGTLFGSFICQDILPWDDDLDILVEERDYSRLKSPQAKEILKEKYGLIFKIIKKMNKIYSASAPLFHEREWGWPFMDIRTFKADGQHVQSSDSKVKKHSFKVPVDVFYPLHLRPFGELWLPSPRKPWHILSKIYGGARPAFGCFTTTWNHQKEIRGKYSPEARCWDLREEYPFVCRQKLGEYTVENLMLGNRVLYSVVVQEEHIEGMSIYNWKFVT